MPWSKRPKCRPGARLKASGRHLMVGTVGFEPTTSASRTLRAAKLRHVPIRARLYRSGYRTPAARSVVGVGGHVLHVTFREELEHLSRLGVSARVVLRVEELTIDGDVEYPLRPGGEGQ